MDLAARAPKVLPWLARHFDIPESVAQQTWQVVVRDAEARFRPEEHGSSPYWSFVTREFRDSLARVHRTPMLGVLHCQEQVLFATYAAGTALIARPWAAFAHARAKHAA